MREPRVPGSPDVPVGESIRPRGRPFGLADGMILVAAIAVGAGVSRAISWPAMLTWRDPFGLAMAACSVMVPQLWIFAALGLALQWRAPVQAGRPGFVACVVAILGLMLTSLQAAAIRLLGRSGIQIDVLIFRNTTLGPERRFLGDGFGRTMIGLWQTVVLEQVDRTGYLILGAWLALLFSRGWHRSEDWRERLGRIVGGCWLAIAAFRWAFFLILG